MGQLLNRPAASLSMKLRESSLSLDATLTDLANELCIAALRPPRQLGSRRFSGGHLPGEHSPPPSQNGLSPPMCRAKREGPPPLHPAATARRSSGGDAALGASNRTGRPSSTKSVIVGPCWLTPWWAMARRKSP